MKLRILAFIIAFASSAALAANTAVLSWNYTNASGDPANDNPTFRIYQGVQGQPKVAGPTTSEKTITIDSGLLFGNTYCWTVTAIANGQESLPSNEACKTFQHPVPSVPTDLQAH